MSDRPKLSIIVDSRLSRDVKVFVGDQEITRSIRDIVITIGIGNLNTAKLTVYVDRLDIKNLDKLEELHKIDPSTEYGKENNERIVGPGILVELDQI